MGYRVYIKNKKTKPHQPGWWDEKKKVEVVTTFLTTGDGKLTATICNVPYETIRTWKKQDWWKKYVEELRYEENAQLDTKLQKVMDKALDQVMDRLENGEFMYDPRTGQVKRVPAKLRDTGKILNDVIDKRQLIQKAEKKEQQKEQQLITADHLVQLAKAFADMAKGKKEKELSVIEGEFTIEETDNRGLQNKEIKDTSEEEMNHAIHEERKT